MFKIKFLNTTLTIFRRNDTGYYYLRLPKNKRVSLQTQNKEEAIEIAKIYFEKYLKPTVLTEIAHTLNNNTENNKDTKSVSSEIKNVMPFSKFLNDILDWYKINRTQGTYRAIRDTVKVLYSLSSPLLDKDISQIKYFDLQQLINDMIVSKRFKEVTINIHVRNLKAIFNKAVDLGVIESNPAQKLKQLKIAKKVPKFIPKYKLPEIIEYLKNYDLHVHDFFLFLLYTGCRRSEIFNITIGDIDLVNNRIRVFRTKTLLESYIPIHPVLKDKITAFIHNAKQNNITDHIKNFKDLKLFYYHPDTYSHKIKKAFKAVGLENYRLHDIRHTFASYLVSSGTSLKIVKELLGHSDYRTTEIYAHLDSNALNTAINNLPNI